MIYFPLPTVSYSKTHKPEGEASPPSTKDKMLVNRTLIVEDDMASDIYLGVITKQFSKEIIHEANGAKAVKICSENPDIDLILMDISLLVMNGLDATRKIREFNKDVIIIV